MKKIIFMILAGFALIGNAQYLTLPDGSYLKIPPNTPQSDYPYIYCKGYTKHPEAYNNNPPSCGVITYLKLKDEHLNAQNPKPLVQILLPDGNWYFNINLLTKDAAYCEAYKKHPESFQMDSDIKSLCSPINVDLTKAFFDASTTLAVRVLLAAFIFFLITFGLLRKSRKLPSENGRWIAGILGSISVISFPTGNKSPEDFYFGITLVTIFWIILGFGIGYLWRYFQNRKSQKPSDQEWESALNEVNSPERDSGLWARCFSDCNGDENKAKAMYIKERVKKRN